MAQPVREKVWQSLRKLKTKLLHDSAIPILGINLKKLKLGLQRDRCTLMFTASLFTVAKIQRTK
jgi:hypothetical protein